MEKYMLLLVDDEEEVLQIIIKKIDWEALGFSVVGFASNGVKAYELVEEYQPDVVMTDIKMPYMDGIELTKRIKEAYPETKILFFTGFDEFEYAKEAVHMEVEEYILKPINSIELKEVFTKLHAKLEHEVSEKRNAEMLQKYYMESLPLLQANFYTMLIEGRVEKEKMGQYLSDYQITLSAPYYCCIVIHTSANQVPEDMSPLLLSTLVRKQAEERLAEKRQVKSFAYLGNLVMIVSLEKEKEITDLTDACDRFCKYAYRFVGAVVTAGVGLVCENLLELPRSYNGAREAVSYRVLYGASRAINIREIVPQKLTKSGTDNDVDLSNLFKMIRLGSRDAIRKAVDQYLQQPSFSGDSLQEHYIAVMDLVNELYRFSVNNDILTEEILGDTRELCDRLFDLVPDMLHKWLVDISFSLAEQLASARSRSTNSFVTEAKQFIYNNYADEGLSLDDICKSLGVSTSYFSTVFKKETGKSFISYLTEFRMERAARMLVETDEKNYVIAGNVGYSDPNYFSYVFKRQYGVSPSKYRMEYKEK